MDWTELCGNIGGIRSLLGQIGTMAWFDGHGELPEGVVLFAIRDDAKDAAQNAPQNTIWDNARSVIRDVAKDDTWNDTWNAIWDNVKYIVEDDIWDATKVVIRATRATRDAVQDAARDIAWNASLLAMTYVCSTLPLDARYIDHVRKRWAVYESGYGVACDVDGVIYAYKNPW